MNGANKVLMALAALVLLGFVLALLLLATLQDFSPQPVEAASVGLSPVKDNTLYEDASGLLSNGAGEHFFAGTTREGFIRRGVLTFDVAAAVPAGATITNVTLDLHVSRIKSQTAQTTELHALLADWGEGTSHAGGEEGAGAPSTSGDATWVHRFYNTDLWTAAGGDFSATVSASTAVGVEGDYAWSSAQMVTDVQSWLDSPSTNFGWIVIGNEVDPRTAKRFDSKENATVANRPTLTVDYSTGTETPGPTPTSTSTSTPTATATPTPEPFTNPLYAPPVLTDAAISVSIQEACVQILPGPCTTMWTYGGSFPGPTIRRPTGQTTQVTYTNNLPAAAGEMTVHLHGGHSSPINDGRPDQYLIATGGSRTYTYDHTEDGGNERGAPQFYHDHRMDHTARNVWMGLAGFYIIDDPADPATLPSGQFDVPLAIQDRQFDSGNQIPYTFDANGVTGDHILINGVYQPYFDVGDRKYRFRILNGSNLRTYNLALSTGQPFTQIGTESGLLPAPIDRTHMRIGPGERLDVVIDFAGRRGDNILLTDTLSGNDLVQFQVGQGHVSDDSSIPSTLRTLPDIGEPIVTRNFDFGKTSGHWTINGLRYDPNRMDARPRLGTTEKWVIHNSTGAPHTVHLHDVDQQCLSRNGGACFPYEPMKETWYLDPDETIEIKLKFSDHTGPYVFHCHMIEHEDDGMMAQFEVAVDSDGDGWTDPSETNLGTDPADACADNPSDDANPADFNNDGAFTGFDLSAIAAEIGRSVPTAPARKDIAPDLADGVITGADISAVASRIGQACTP